MTPITTIPIHHYHNTTLTPTTDTLAEEIPTALVYNGISHVVLMATPQDLAELALGFSLSEGILNHARELYDVQIEPSCEGMTVQMEIASARFMALKERRRNMTGRTGCGLCGIDSLAHAMPDVPTVSRQHNIRIDHINQALRALPEHQPCPKPHLQPQPLYQLQSVHLHWQRSRSADRQFSPSCRPSAGKSH